MEKILLQLFTSPDSSALLLGIKLAIAFFIVRYVKNFLVKLLGYILVIAHDSSYGVVYRIDDEYWSIDRVTFNYVMLNSLDDARLIRQIPIKNWSTMNRTIVLTNKTSCNITNSKSK